MLSRFAQTEIIEVPDEPLAGVKSTAGETAALLSEEARILPRLSGHVIACDIVGRQMSSEGFAGYLKDRMLEGTSEICFVVGGSIGLSDNVKSKAALRLSVSRMTMPHRLFRIVILEQVYRAFKIINGETYHK
jgi:23S rRNA (pseudouridine1915-N3)-methyltransferase